MKKLLALLLAALLTLSLAACAGNGGSAEPTRSETEIVEDAQSAGDIASASDPGDTESVPEDADAPMDGEEVSDEGDIEIGEETEIVDEESHLALTGGWTLADSPEITPDIAELTQKAAESMGGTTLTPLAYIGSQVVAGTNHCLLCLSDPEVRDEESLYCILYLYQDLEGNVQVLDMMECNIEVPESGLEGGWSTPASPVLSDEARAAFDKAMEGMQGVDYTPIALVGEQVVAGMNYCILCQSQVESPDAEATFSLVYVYADLDGGASLSDVVDFSLNAG